ncbi:MAG: 50S ribosomal protein L13 [Candidatus Omnitrophica bacterium]|nr:50S ribosomal protein L13 [Candidatus Omnitrophota bacterium]MCM8802225.1 50S ribosomal protein L13 [Candidatus Omnitrophota bacterium]
MTKTKIARKEEIKRKWYLVDANGQILGRLASKVAKILMGKHKPIYTPNVDTGDFVIVINAEKIRVTGKKLTDKIYYKHIPGYLGHLKEEKLISLLNRRPEAVIRFAVEGMLPKNSLGRKMLKKLKIYKGESHPHYAQKPELLNLKEVKI